MAYDSTKATKRPRRYSGFLLISKRKRLH